MNRKLWLGSALAVSCLFVWRIAGAVNLVVMDAKGGGLKAGAVIDSATPLNLAEGESASLVADTGRIVRLKGPHSGPALASGEAAAGSVKDAMASLLSAGDKDKGALGATRSADSTFKMAKDGKKTPSPPDLWMVDVSQGGVHCYQEGERMVFWRPDPSRDTNIRVTLGNDIWKAHTDWPKGKSSLLLPDNVPVQDGMKLTADVEGKKTEAVLYEVPKTVATDPARVAWLHEKGCQNQFMALLSTIKQ
ncbi:MAG: hypothetical protein HQL77_10560 [Magnetococcales bacterium]|nr:hypothetical protein [Magnetococcales bacterium]